MDPAIPPKIKRNGQRPSFVRLQRNCPFEPNCPEHFDSKATLNTHLHVVHQSHPYRCLVSNCTASFRGTYEAGAHINSAHSDLPSFQCPKCPKSYSNYTKLRDHHFDNHQTGLLQCLHPNCNQIFNNPAKVYRHQRVHSTVNCTQCGKIIKRHNLVEHQKVHSAEKIHKCTTCELAFTTKGNLEAHARLHSGVKPYTCSICGRAFTQRSHMKAHEEAHHEASSLQCDHCPKKFGGKLTLSQHFRQCHREQWTSIRELRKKEQESFLRNLHRQSETAAEVQKPRFWRPWI